MEFRSLDIISQLEKNIQQGYKLPIFSGYVAINKRGIEKFIEMIYTTLPDDVANARKFLRNRQLETSNKRKSRIYDSLEQLETQIDKAPSFFPTYVIVQIKEIEKLLDKVRDTLPEEILKAQNVNNQ